MLHLVLYNLYSYRYRRSAAYRSDTSVKWARSTARGISCLRKPWLMSEICPHTPDRHLCSCVGQRKEANERKCNIWCIWSTVNPPCFHRGGSDRWGVLHEHICGFGGHLLQPGLYMHNKCSKPGVCSCFTASLQQAAFTSKQAPSDKWQSSNIWPEWLKQREASAVQEQCFFYIYMHLSCCFNSPC